MMKLNTKWMWLSLVLIGNHGFAAEPSGPTVAMDLSFYGKGVDEDFNRGQRLGAEVEGYLSHQFTPTLNLLGRVLVTAEVGGAQAAFNEDYAPKQEIALREARLDLHPWEPLHLQVGAVDQDSWGANKLMFDSQAFPSLRENFHVPINKFFVDLGAQQSIANTPVVTFGTPVPSEGYPFYFMERVAAGWKEGDDEIEVHGAHFQFQKLPSSSAFDSRYYGNTVTGTANTDAAFEYNFQGFEGGLSGKTWIRPWLQPRFNINAVLNTSAPTDRNFSYLVSIANRIQVDNTLSLTPEVFVFQMGQDASPAIYSASDWGHNNRRGYGLGLDAEMEKERISFGAQGVKAPTISPNPFQGDWFYFTVYFKSRYDII